MKAGDISATIKFGEIKTADAGIFQDFATYHPSGFLGLGLNAPANDLQSFIENVKYISSYLSIYMDTSSDFAIMVSYYFINNIIIIIIIIYYYLYYLLYRVNFYH